jgi:hypothetical protein
MKSSVFQEEFVQPAGQKALLHILINLLLQDLIKIYFDFRNDFCVSVEFGSYAARNMFP